MATDVMPLREYAELLGDLADDWDGEQPVVLIGDVNGNMNVTEKDGYTQHGSVGFAQECFDGNGVMELGQNSDRRFYGTMLFEAEDLAEDAQAQLDLTEFGDGGDA